jgi:drug/metabolite transporter (DMT)-like permease
MILLLLLYALCASSFTISKAVLSYSAPIFFVGVRMTIAGLLLLGYVWYESRSIRIAKKDRGLFAAIIFFHIYITYIADVWSLQYVSSFKSAFFFNLSPFITALLSYFFLQERMTHKQWLGLFLGFIGFLPMMFKEVPAEEAVGTMFFISIPEIFLLVSVVASCIGWITMKRLLHKGYTPVHINGVGMLYGGIAALATSLASEHWFVASPVSNWPMFAGLTGLIIVACNVLFYNFYGILLHRYSATFMSFAGFTCPLFTALFGILFLHEHVTWHFVVAMLIVSFGLYIFYQEELSQGS